jgi:hypothetical protein
MALNGICTCIGDERPLELLTPSTVAWLRKQGLSFPQVEVLLRGRWLPIVLMLLFYVHRRQVMLQVVRSSHCGIVLIMEKTRMGG